MNPLFLAWQDAVTRRWFPIGKLTQVDGRYRFVYVRGVQEAQSRTNFQLLPSFPSLEKVYESLELFPLFANRVMPPSRADFPHYVEWLHLNGSEKDPMKFLAHSGGRRMTDTLEVFPAATRHDDGRHTLHFFVHGLRHMSPDSIVRAERLENEERLLVQWDAQNPEDDKAITLRTDTEISGDASLVGYCPRCLAAEVLKALQADRQSCTVRVARVNAAPAPVQFRLLCCMEFAPQSGVVPFSSPEFQPMVSETHGTSVGGGDNKSPGAEGLPAAKSVGAEQTTGSR